MKTPTLGAWFVLPLCLGALFTPVKGDVPAPAPVRISPVVGVAAGSLSPIESSLLLSPLQVTQLKTQILRYLTQNAGVPLRLTSMPSGDRDTRWVSQQIQGAKDVRQKYQVMGQHLLAADFLLRSRYADPQLTGMDIARIASRDAFELLGDSRLSAQIAQAYLLPNYAWADQGVGGALSRVGIALRLVEAYQAIQDDPKLSPGEKYLQEENLIEAHKLFITVTQDETKADYARWNISKVLERRFRYEEAIGYLREIDPAGTQRNARKEIPRLEALLQKQRQDAAELAARLAGANAKNAAPQNSTAEPPQSTPQDKQF